MHQLITPRWAGSIAFSLTTLCSVAINMSGSTPSFSARRDYETSDSMSVVSGDVNSDGIPDLVSGNNGLAIQFGNGDGTFRVGPVIKMDYSVGTLVLADVNHDGKLDALFGASLLNQWGFAVAYGNGDGTFANTPVFYQAGSDYSGLSLVAGDFNNDGILDAATLGDSGAWIYLGKGDGVFSSGVLVAFANPLPILYCCLSIGDLDGDGNLDLVGVWSTGITGGYAVLSGEGNGLFKPAIEYQTPSIPYNITLADLNHDQRLDIVVISDFFKGYAYVQLGNGDGSFATGRWNYLPGGEFVAIGDLNGDGNPDLISNYGYVAYGHGDGTFKNATYTPVGNALLNGDSSKILLADLRGKALPDIVAANWFGTLSVLLNKGNGTFRDGFYYILNGPPACPAVADYNGDGKPDLAVVLNSGISILLGTGKASTVFQQGFTFSVPNAYCLAAGDLNHDGITDLVVVSGSNVIGGNGSATSFLGNGDGTFGEPSILTLNPEPGSPALADLNNDGNLDLALSGNLLAFGNGDGSFQPMRPLASLQNGDYFTNIVAGDINGDGWTDIVGVEADIETGYILANQRNGTFGVHYFITNGGSTPACGGLPIVPAIADLNRDGLNDFAVLCDNGDIIPYFNNGVGSFHQGPTVLSPLISAVSMTVSDLNGDGVLDIATVNLDSLAIYVGNGDGTFQTPIYFGLGPYPGQIVTALLHGASGISDLAVTDAGYAIDVLLNNTK